MEDLGLSDAPQPVTHLGALTANPILRLAPRALLEELVAASSLRHYVPGQRILSDGEPARHVFALQQGVVRVFHVSATGQQVVVKLFKAPVLFGEVEAFSRVPHTENVDAVTPATILVMPQEHMFDVLRRDHACALAMIRDLSARFSIASQIQKSYIFDPATTRLANFLLDYVLCMAVPGEDAPLIKLTQEQMAAATGVSRRVVNQDIMAWQKEGLVSRRGRYYRITDLEGLKRYSDPAHLCVTYRLGEPIARTEERLPSSRLRARGKAPDG